MMLTIDWVFFFFFDSCKYFQLILRKHTHRGRGKTMRHNSMEGRK